MHKHRVLFCKVWPAVQAIHPLSRFRLETVDCLQLEKGESALIIGGYMHVASLHPLMKIVCNHKSTY